MKSIAICVAACLAGAVPAHAETHALTAAKKILPAGQTLVAANFAAIAQSSSFKTLWAGYLAKNKDVADTLDKVKKTCSVDAIGVIDSVVVAMPNLDSGAQGVFVVAFKGLQRKDVDDCLTKMVGAEDQKAVKVTTEKGVTSYDSGKDSLQLRWLDKTTVAFAPSGKDTLLKMTAGGMLASKPMAAALKNLRSDATIAMVVNQTVPLESLKPGATASMGYGSAVLSGGNVKLDVHLVTDADATATELVTTASTQLAQIQQNPPMMANVIKSITVKAAAKEIVMGAQMTEKELLQMLALAAITASP